MQSNLRLFHHLVLHFPVPAAWLHIAHRLIVAITGLMMGSLLFKAWKTQRTQTPILVTTTVAAVFFFSQALLGSQMVAGYPPYLLGLHQATAAGVWAAATGGLNIPSLFLFAIVFM